MPNPLQPSRGLFIGYLGDSFTFSDAAADFLKQNGVKVFYKSPTSGQIQSWASASGINALTGVTQFNSYQVDNNSTQTISFPDRWVGFGVAPDISHLTGGGSPSPSPSPGTGDPESFTTRRLKASAISTDMAAVYYAAGGNKEFVNPSAVISLANRSGAAGSFTYVPYPTAQSASKAIENAALGDYIRIQSSNIAGVLTDCTLQWRGKALAAQNDGTFICLRNAGGNEAIRISGFAPEAPATTSNITVGITDDAGVSAVAYGSNTMALNTEMIHTIRISSSPRTLTYFIGSTAHSTVDLSTLGTITLSDTMLLGLERAVTFASKALRSQLQLAAFYKKALTNTEIAASVTTALHQLEPIS